MRYTLCADASNTLSNWIWNYFLSVFNVFFAECSTQIVQNACINRVTRVTTVKISENPGFQLTSRSSPQMHTLPSIWLQNIVLYPNHRWLNHIAHVSHTNFKSKTAITNTIILSHTLITQNQRPRQHSTSKSNCAGYPMCKSSTVGIPIHFRQSHEYPKLHYRHIPHIQT